MSGSNPEETPLHHSVTRVPPIVTGWLLFLCLLLTLVVPGQYLYRVCTHTLPLLAHTHDQGQFLLLSLFVAMFGAVAIWSFLAGLQLWLVRNGAVQFARTFLLVAFTVNVAYFILWWLIARSTGTARVEAMAFDHVFAPLASTFL